LYVARIRPGTITDRRIAVFQRLGFDVETFDLRPYTERLRDPVSRRLAFRMDWGPIVKMINRDLNKRAQQGG